MFRIRIRPGPSFFPLWIRIRRNIADPGSGSSVKKTLFFSYLRTKNSKTLVILINHLLTLNSFFSWKRKRITILEHYTLWNMNITYIWFRYIIICLMIIHTWIKFYISLGMVWQEISQNIICKLWASHLLFDNSLAKQVGTLLR